MRANTLPACMPATAPGEALSPPTAHATTNAASVAVGNRAAIGFLYDGQRTWLVARPLGHGAGVRITLVPAGRRIKWKTAPGSGPIMATEAAPLVA